MKSVAGTVQDPTIKFSELNIDGEILKLCYSFNTIAIAESMCGVNLLKGIQRLDDLTASQLRGLLYASLLVAQPKMTPEDAGNLIRFDTMPAVVEAIGNAYSLSMPEKKSETEPGPAAK